MLTEPASNALLKTLEEPPPHAIFILATTEPHKLLPTLLSRCQRFDFHRLSHNAVVSKLTYICQQEGISIEPQGLRLIAKSVSGGLRDAENLLQQLAVYYGNQIDACQVEDMLGITADFRVRELVEHIANKDIAAGLETINSLVSDGLDLSQFNRGLVECLRNMLLAKSGTEASLDLGVEDLVQIKELSSRILMEDILKALKLFGQIDFRFKDYSSLPLELALVECILPEEKETSPKKKGTVLTGSTIPIQKAEPSLPGSPPLEISPDTEYVRAQWGDFVDTLRGMGSSGNLDAFLRSACEPVAVEGDTLVLAFYYSFHKEKIEDSKYRHLVEKKLSEKFGSPSRVRCVLRPRAKQRAMEGHLVKAALEMGGRVTSVVENSTLEGGEK